MDFAPLQFQLIHAGQKNWNFLPFFNFVIL